MIKLANRKATIAIFSYEIWKHPRALKIAKTLVKHGFKVKLWGSRKPLRKGPRVIRGILNYIFAIFEVFTIRATIYWIENVPDIIYLPLFFLKKNIVYDRRSPWAKQVLLETKNVLLYKVAEVIERYALKKAEKVVVVSTPMKYEYEKTKEAEVIPNFPEKIFKKKNTEDVRSKLGIGKDVKVFIYIGKLSVTEGAPLLAKAIKRLCNKHSVAEIWIVGDGPARNIIINVSRNCSNIRVFGWVKRSKVIDYIASSNYGLVPRFKNFLSVFYNHEGIHKIGEYLVYGKPVIACGLAPSKYYLNVDPEEFDKTIEKVALEKLKVEAQKRFPLWEEVSENKILKVVNELLEKRGQAFWK